MLRPEDRLDLEPEDRLTLEEELLPLREEDTLDEEPELLWDDTDLEREEEDEIRLAADLDAEDLDVLIRAEDDRPLLRREEETDEEEREILFLAEELSALDVDDLFTADERDGDALEFRLRLELMSAFNLDGYTFDPDLPARAFPSLEDEGLERTDEAALERDTVRLLEGYVFTFDSEASLFEIRDELLAEASDLRRGEDPAFEALREILFAFVILLGFSFRLSLWTLEELLRRVSGVRADPEDLDREDNRLVDI